MDDLTLAARPGLPDALRVLLAEYPRELWSGHRHFDGLVSFRRDRHLMFRRLTGVLREDAQARLDGRMAAEAWARRRARAGGHLPADLDGHHRIEDAHHFPALAAAEPRLARGFGLLDADHAAHHHHLAAFAAAADAALAARGARDPAGTFLGALDGLARLLDRHLTDEEELVVPVIRRHGPAVAGWACLARAAPLAGARPAGRARAAETGMDGIEGLRERFIAAIAAAADEAALEEVRLAALGKKGEIALLMRELGRMPPEDRAVAGPAYNALKDEIDAALRARKAALADAALEARLAAEWLDVTLPARPRRQGTIHPVSQVTEECTAIFADMGFAVAEGPQVETDWFNFDALNIAPEHPARQEHDTFFMARAAGDNRPPHVLRTHTSPVQIRAMQARGAPLRVIAPGRVYRMDMDQTHTPMFHQIEGLAIDRDITMAHLKWVLEAFFGAFFGRPVRTRFRASHFPFTEPSAEVDIQCSWVGGQLRVGEGDGWLEVLGSGMVHPKVLAAGGIDPDAWQGFAFGMGIDRIAMLKYGIPDLRAFFEADVRWLRHYGFGALEAPTLHAG